MAQSADYLAVSQESFGMPLPLSEDKGHSHRSARRGLLTPASTCLPMLLPRAWLRAASHGLWPFLFPPHCAPLPRTVPFSLPVGTSCRWHSWPVIFALCSPMSGGLDSAVGLDERYRVPQGAYVSFPTLVFTFPTVFIFFLSLDRRVSCSTDWL